jgi:hypothetical protein
MDVKMKTRLLFLLIALLILSACDVGQPAKPFVRPTAIPTAAQVLPTPSSTDDVIVWSDLQVRMIETEMTDSFINEFGSPRSPAPETQFLWIHVAIKNIGSLEIDIPSADHFSALYAGSEFKPLYAHRQDYFDYTALAEKLFPDQQAEGWLRFDLPIAAEMQDILFVYLPINYQVSVSPSSPSYPWGDDPKFPAFVWKCEP